MAQINKSSLLAALSGTLGKELVIKQYKDKVVVSRYPDMSWVKPSPLQLQNRERMKAATAYAQTVLRNPQLRTAMEKELKPGESVYHKAKRQYLMGLK
jgi:hypothetical protein